MPGDVRSILQKVYSLVSHTSSWHEKLVILIKFMDISQWKWANKLEVGGILRVKFGPNLTSTGNGHSLTCSETNLSFIKKRIISVCTA